MAETPRIEYGGGYQAGGTAVSESGGSIYTIENSYDGNYKYNLTVVDTETLQETIDLPLEDEWQGSTPLVSPDGSTVYLFYDDVGEYVGAFDVDREWEVASLLWKEFLYTPEDNRHVSQNGDLLIFLETRSGPQGGAERNLVFREASTGMEVASVAIGSDLYGGDTVVSEDSFGRVYIAYGYSIDGNTEIVAYSFPGAEEGPTKGPEDQIDQDNGSSTAPAHWVSLTVSASLMMVGSVLFVALV